MCPGVFVEVGGGNKLGIPDIIGIDADGNFCIIEMKNVTVDASIIHQVLQYAFWQKDILPVLDCSALLL